MVDFGLQQGILAGIIFAVGCCALWFLPQRFQWWLAALLLLGVTPLAIGGFLLSPHAWGISDWDYYFSLHHSYRTTILEYHQFPLWNPYTCGGTAALGDPEFSVLTPTFALELIFGIERGLRLAIILATAIGAVSMLLLGKRIGLPVFAATIAALGYGFGSVNLLEVVEGHVNIFSAMWIPLIWWAWLGAYRKQLSPLWCGVFLALTFYQGGIYLLSYTALAFILIPLLVKKPLYAWRTSIIAGLWALGLAAFKLIPVLFWLRQFQDTAYASSTYTLPYLHEILFKRHLHGEENVIPNQGSSWHEYGAYVGVPLGLLALIGIVTGWKKRMVRGLIITFILSLLVSSAGPLLKPIFDVISFIPRSNISRLILFSVISLVLLAGFGFKTLSEKIPRVKILVLLILGIVAIDLMSLSFVLSQQAFVLPPVIPLPSPAPKPVAFSAFTYKTRYQGVDYTRAYAATLAGYGSLNYCSVLSPVPAVRTIHDEGSNGIVTVKGAIQSVAWSPNTVRIVGEASQADQLFLNTNFAKGWHSSSGSVVDRERRVAVPVNPGSFDITLWYSPPGMYAGLALTLGTIIAAIVFSLMQQKKSYA